MLKVCGGIAPYSDTSRPSSRFSLCLVPTRYAARVIATG